MCSKRWGQYPPSGYDKISTGPIGRQAAFFHRQYWYMNANCLHGVNNESQNPRIHLMMDCIVNPWLEKVFLDAGFVPDASLKYGDASINDENVGAIISGLIAMNNEPAKQMAERLIAMQKSGTSS